MHFDKLKFTTCCASCALIALLSHPLHAADADPNTPAVSTATDFNSDHAANQGTAMFSENPLSRWLDINTLSTSLRYRSTENSVGIHLFEFGQHREILDGRVKLDREGKYSINFHASSGRYFNWAYADAIGGDFSEQAAAVRLRFPPATGAAIGLAVHVDPDGPTYVSTGIPSRGGYFYLRQLYFSATPVKPVTFEFGSLPIEHGENTETTTFDDDGYIAGERVRVHDADHLFFTEIDGTWAYIGDPFIPNFFARGERLAQNNYQQYLVKKKLKRFAVSADYTRLRGTNTLREAIRAKLPELHLIDSARLELYQRTNNISLYGVNFNSGAGFSLSGSKTFAKRLKIEAGFASIDRNYSAYTGSPFLAAVGFSWNSDAFETGRRFYTRANLTVAPGVTLFGFATHDVGEAVPYVDNRQSVNAGLNVDLAPLMHRAHIL